MATLSTSAPTLFDWSKEVDPSGKTARIAMLLSQQNAILEDMVWIEGNLPTGHRISQQTSLPTSYWRLLNAGVAPSKGTTTQVDEQCGILENWSEVDADIAKLNGNTNSYRTTRATMALESMNQEMSGTIFYGSAASPEEFIGLSNRYSATTAGNGQNILLAGGAGADNSSVWLIGWGENTVSGIFPKGSKAGIMHEDLGLVTVEVTAGVAGNRMRAYQDHWQWKAGIALHDWRYAVRIANIDNSELAGLSGAQELTDATLIIKLMSRAIDRLPSLTGVRPVFYANRTVMSLLRVVALEKSSSAVTIEQGLNQFGQSIHTMRFLGIPVRMCDQLTSAESLVA
jgi:hypothetical protein